MLFLLLLYEPEPSAMTLSFNGASTSFTARNGLFFLKETTVEGRYESRTGSAVWRGLVGSPHVWMQCHRAACADEDRMVALRKRPSLTYRSRKRTYKYVHTARTHHSGTLSMSQSRHVDEPSRTHALLWSHCRFFMRYTLGAN